MINGIVQSFGNVVVFFPHFQVQTSELLARCQCQSMFMIKGGCGIYWSGNRWPARLATPLATHSLFMRGGGIFFLKHPE